jgi:hypothetical protein
MIRLSSHGIMKNAGIKRADTKRKAAALAAASSTIRWTASVSIVTVLTTLAAGFGCAPGIVGEIVWVVLLAAADLLLACVFLAG